MLIKEEYIMLDPRDTLQNLKQHGYRIELTLKRGELLTFIGQVFTYFALNNMNKCPAAIFVVMQQHAELKQIF